MRLTSIPTEADDLAAAFDALAASLAGHEHLYVAFSGGADSAFLTAAAAEVLGVDRVTAVTAISPSLASAERADCAAFAAELGLRWVEVETDEMEQAAYRRNDGDRCFWCKDALMRAVGPIVGEVGTVALGVNVDDLGDHRPGQRAAAEAGALFPLVEAGFTKAMVREASRRMGLRTWDKPAAACLASRIPYGTAVSVAVLGRVERAEQALRAMGFDELRVRHYDDTARIEVPTSRFAEVAERAAEVAGAVSACGYRYVTLDLQGLRSGNLNQALG